MLKKYTEVVEEPEQEHLEQMGQQWRSRFKSLQAA